MQKAKMRTEDGVRNNIAEIRRLFPHCVTEARNAAGEIACKIDYDLLRQELSADLIEEGAERYALSWPGKKEAVIQANASIDKTLRPVTPASQPHSLTASQPHSLTASLRLIHRPARSVNARAA